MRFFHQKFIFCALAIIALHSGYTLAGINGDANNGAAVFNAQCGVCHSIKEGKNKIGPSLAGVVGRDAGSISNFVYSDAMKNSGMKWTKENLDAYLAKPKALLPGIKMPYEGLPDDKARGDLIAYLSAQSK